LNTPPDDRSALARALELGSLATTIALEMVVPIVLGLLLDRWLGTKAVFTIVGGVVGMAGGLWQLIRLSRELTGKSEKNRRSKDTAWPEQPAPADQSTGQPPVNAREDDTPLS
jgi:F0F1-type ATP synthase assembly protein I